MFNIVGDLKTLSVAVAACVICASLAGGVGYFKGQHACELKNVVHAADKTLSIEEKKDAIRAVPLDDSVTIKRLRAGTAFP